MCLSYLLNFIQFDKNVFLISILNYLNHKSYNLYMDLIFSVDK
jgi:hypothetical protein